ncbi:PREDICTED: uncharacterized protein LOC108977595 [Bactrocera latifrons]|uniref:uncharacterized protein LOC108977595 n=1 Tax=Bactrocera latifrons TaxID=174628 RepID=UPI0008DD6BEC|nr:PREDICTED: uncharacterized protein LOC108977595 [Bactrocera latifrons]
MTSYWTPHQYIGSIILITLHKEFKTLLGPSGHSGSTFIFVSLFSLILFNNFIEDTPQAAMPLKLKIDETEETISNIIRPGTLAVRLAANIISEHLLLTLLGNTGP